MRKQNDGGFSLIEVLIAMVMLAAIVVPTCTSLVLSTKVNQKADALMKAKLAVSSAVETLMAQGIDATRAENAMANGGVYDIIPEETEGEEQLSEGVIPEDNNTFPDVGIVIISEDTESGAYRVKVTDNAELVYIETYIRPATGGAS